MAGTISFKIYGLTMISCSKDGDQDSHNMLNDGLWKDTAQIQAFKTVVKNVGVAYAVIYKTSSFAGYCFFVKNSMHLKGFVVLF